MASWSFTESYVPVRSDGKAEFTAAEFARQQWPPCPVCGTRVQVDPIHTPSADGRDVYIPGRVRCPNSCTPTA